MNGNGYDGVGTGVGDSWGIADRRLQNKPTVKSSAPVVIRTMEIRRLRLASAVVLAAGEVATKQGSGADVVETNELALQGGGFVVHIPTIIQ